MNRPNLSLYLAAPVSYKENVGVVKDQPYASLYLTMLV
jgi:hypothetical protein